MKTIFNPKEQLVPIYLWTDDIESQALDQMKSLARLPFLVHHVAGMPDVHAGLGSTIGSVFAADGNVIPAAVGVDIGCGMCAVNLQVKKKEAITTKLLNDAVTELKRAIPTGFSWQKKKQSWGGLETGYTSHWEKEIKQNASRQLGTLGGGNHFLEIQHEPDTDDVWVMIHSGSRKIGKKIADHYIKIAKQICAKKKFDHPKSLSYLSVEDKQGREYIQDMNWALAFAFENRKRMMAATLDSLKLLFYEYYKVTLTASMDRMINIHHNYAAEERHFGKKVWVHRKGATLASEGTIGIIPGSMGASSYIVRGLGNPDSFNSCSHGAGRTMSRKAAKQNIPLAEFKKSLEGVVADVSKAFLDEAPQAYKNIDKVMEDQKDLVEILHRLKPLAVMKGA